MRETGREGPRDSCGKRFHPSAGVVPGPHLLGQASASCVFVLT